MIYLKSSGIWVTLAAFAIFLPSLVAKPISDLLKEKDGQFDPWDQKKWAAWYKDGQIVEPFEIDRSVTFAPRETPWTFDTRPFEKIHGETAALFPITGREPLVIDGNNVTLDTRTPEAKALTIQDWYTKSYKVGQLVSHVYGFKFMQKGPVTPPSVLRNITLMGFWRAVDTAQARENPAVHLENITAQFNGCAFYTNGMHGVIRNCTVTENIMMGIYADQASNDWLIENNTFRDNGLSGTRSWSAITLDSCYDYTIRNNKFLAATATPRDYHSAITFYRNQGERKDIREYSSSWNLITDNIFQGYNLAIDVGVRMGKRPSSIQTNLAREGRCYVDYNTIRNNAFENCIVGILLRTGFNAVDSNRFENVKVPIALNNAFYTLQHNLISNQENEQVAVWSEPGEYPDYVKYVANHSQPGPELGSNIKPEEKLYHVISPTGRPKFSASGAATLLISEKIVGLPDDRNIPNYNLFEVSSQQASKMGFTNKPIDIAVGKFSAARPSGDFAAIFDQPSSMVGNEKNYSIILYDQNGAEFERCGRSKKRWSKIAAGNFLRDTGAHLENGNHEVAAVSSEPDKNGCYPVYIFRKGIAYPGAILLRNNKLPIKGLAAGRFKNGSDGYDELAVLLDGSSKIMLIKPSDQDWSKTLETNTEDLFTIVAGEFNGNSSDGDEIAALSAQASPIQLFKLGYQGAYATTGYAAPWKLLSAGNFQEDKKGTLQLAAIRTGSENTEAHFFEPGSTDAFRITSYDLPGGIPIQIQTGEYEKANPSEPKVNGRFVMGGLYPNKTMSPEVRLAILPHTSPSSVPVLVWASTQDTASKQMTVIPILK